MRVNDPQAFFMDTVLPQIDGRLTDDLQRKYARVSLYPQAGFVALSQTPMLMLAALTGTGKGAHASNFHTSSATTASARIARAADRMVLIECIMTGDVFNQLSRTGGSQPSRAPLHAGTANLPRRQQGIHVNRRTPRCDKP
jgi:hypothetical protein